MDGVDIRAVPLPPNRLSRMTITNWRVFRTALQVKADVYHFHDPELIPVGFLLKLLNKRVVYDAHENLPEDIRVKKYLNPMVRSILALMAICIEAMAGVVFDGIITVVPKIAERFPKKKTIILANYPILPEGPTPESSVSGSAQPFTMVYTGGMSEFRGISEMVRALELVNHRHPARLVMAGAFSRQDYEQSVKNEPGWRHVDYRGLLSSKEALALVQEAQVGLLLFQPSPHNIESSPNKLFEYFMCGLPVVLSDFPYWHAGLDRYQCGLFVDPTDAQATADAICWLIEHPADATEMGARGRAAVVETFNWQSESRKLIGMYQQILGVEHG